MTIPPTPSAPKRRAFQFTLRTLLLLTLVCGVGLGLVARWLYRAIEQELRRQREVAAALEIEEWGGAVVYENEELANSPVILVFLSNARVADAELSKLEPLTRLQELRLENTQVTDAGLERLLVLKNLQWIRLSGTRVSDAGLAHLARLKPLKGLCLAHTQVTDAGLKDLEELKELEYLSLAGTQTSEEAIARLQSALPNTMIVR